MANSNSVGPDREHHVELTALVRIQLSSEILRFDTNGSVDYASILPVNDYSLHLSLGFGVCTQAASGPRRVAANQNRQDNKRTAFLHVRSRSLEAANAGLQLRRAISIRPRRKKIT